MEVKINSQEIAEAIAAKVEQVTGLDCEAYTNQVGAIIVHNLTQVIARVTPLISTVEVTPIGGTFDGEPIAIPAEARTINGLKEIADAMDDANMRAISAAVKH